MGEHVSLRSSIRKSKDMHVIGGTYLESVQDRGVDRLFGSGFRAAACLSHLDDIKFHSYIGGDCAAIFAATAKSFGLVKNEIEAVAQARSFAYATSLARPSVNAYGHDPNVRVICVRSEEPILRFGMLEQEAVVHGKKVVYDPQNPYDPLVYWGNGSTAEELVIVANHKEVRSLFGDDVAGGIRRQFGQHPELVCVVRKYGPLGADVFTPDGSVEHIPAYRTHEVFSVGTGDVFSAYFSYFWSVAGKPFAVAADLASRAVAKYVSGVGSIQKETEETLTHLPYKPVNSSRPKIAPIYLAGPFFTLEETMFLQEIKHAFSSMDVPVFSPIDDVGVGDAAKVYRGDIKGLVRSDSVFANVCGMDAGTIYEIGYAKALGKSVTVFAQDCKQKDMTMFVGGGCNCFSDFTSAVYNAVWDTM